VSSTQKKLLLFLVDGRCLVKSPIMATLAWVAEEEGFAFDSYICSDFIEFLGMKIDGSYFSDMHAEQVFHACNVYDVHYCSYGETRRFLRDLRAFKKKPITIGKSDLPSFYLDLFSYFKRTLPNKAVMVRCDPIRHEGTREMCLDSYCYPDVYYRQALGIGSNATDQELSQLQKIGVTNVSTLYCGNDVVDKLRKQGFYVEVLDSLRPGDSYASVTRRIADRWLYRARGFAVGDPQFTSFWIPFFCRNNLISIYDTDWKSLAPVVASYCEKKKNNVVWGFQPSDHLITELSKYDKVMQIVTYMRPLLPVAKEILGTEPPHVSGTYWDVTYSEKQLSEKADAGGIAACILFFAENLCHFGAIPRMFELAKLTRTKIGVASNVSWYEYAANWMEDTLIPVESGGCFPLVEPLLCSAGLGAATEAKGYLSSKMLLTSLREARRRVAELWRDELVPIGYYPWQDANPYYRPDTAEPQFDVVKEAGFQYYVTCKNMDQPPQIVYQDGDFIAVNQQNSMIDLTTLTRILAPELADLSQQTSSDVDQLARVPWSYDPLNDVKRWEEILSAEKRPGWIIISLDSPFWGFSPFYFDRAHMLKSAMEYVRKGGETKKLFTASPYDVVCYAKTLSSRGLL
jgi:hypothetical protein